MKTRSNLFLLSNALWLCAFVLLTSCNNEAFFGNEAAENREGELATTPEQFNEIMANPEANYIIRNHADLLQYIQSDELLNEVLTGELRENFMYNTSFNQKGLMTFDYSAISDAYPDELPLILERLGAGFGFNFDELADDYKEYTCSKKGNCAYKQANICTSNCEPLPDFEHDFSIYDILKVTSDYIRKSFEKDFYYVDGELNSVPARYPSSWFFDRFEVANISQDESVRQWLTTAIEEEQILIYGTTILNEQKSGDVVSLVFTRDAVLPEVFEGSPGLILDNLDFSNSGDDYCHFGVFFSAPSCPGCWYLTRCDMGFTCESCPFSQETGDIGELIHPKYMINDLDLLSKMPLNSVLPEQPLINLQ